MKKANKLGKTNMMTTRRNVECLVEKEMYVQFEYSIYTYTCLVNWPRSSTHVNTMKCE